MNRIVMAMTVAVLGGSIAFGSGVQIADVASNAKWVAHIDMAAVRDSQVGKSLMQGKEWEEFSKKMTALKEIVGVDLSKDLDSATLYGPDYSEEKNVAIIRGRMDIPKIKTLISLFKEYKENEIDNGLVYTWTDEKNDRPVACAFHGDDTIVVSSDRQAAADAIAVLDRRATALTGKSGLRLPEDHKGSFLTAAAIEHNGRIGRQQNAAMAAQADWFTMGVGEEMGKLGMNLTVGAKTEESALQMEQVVNGFKALAMMSEDLDQETRNMLMGASVTRSGNAVTVSIKGDVEAIVKAIRDGQSNNGIRKQHGHQGRNSREAKSETAQ